MLLDIILVLIILKQEISISLMKVLSILLMESYLVNGGNFVNRTLQFINKSFNGKLNSSNIDSTIEAKLKDLYITVGNDIDNGDTKDGLAKIFDFINYSNKYFDENKPWKLAKEDVIKCEDILYNCCNIIFNINNLLKPYFVETTKKGRRIFK